MKVSARQFEHSQYILREGDVPRHCSFVRSGVVYRHKVVQDGGKQIVSLHIQGDFVDVQNILFSQSDHNIQALTATTLFCVRREDLLAAVMENGSIGLALWRESLIEASIMREWITNMGRRDALTRTAHLLCELALRHELAHIGERNSFDLEMSQEKLGDALGLTAVHVNRMLRILSDRALIRRSKRSVAIADWSALQRLGDFTSLYLHREDMTG